jgi:hypothetical protein
VKHWTALGVLIAIWLALGGCSLLGGLAYKLSPPATTPAQYKLGIDPAVVLVENSRNPSQTEVDASLVAALLRDDLARHKSAVLVEQHAVLRLRDRDPAAFAKMSITEIGRAVGAQQVVYVDLHRVSVEVDSGNQMVRGAVEASVRVIDVRTGANRWPQDVPQGVPIGFETPYTDIGRQMTDASVRRVLHEKLVRTIGRLFRDWVPETDDL